MAEYQHVNLSIEDGIATVVVNHPPVNSLSTPVIQDMMGAFNEIKGDASVKAVIITGAGMFFIAGADIKEISEIKDPKHGAELAGRGQKFFREIELMDIPVIAAINGMCLGGGTELAMACHMRIASDRAKIGQPEINLGIIPGFGGTQRFPRLAGTGKAYEVILSGEPITAAEAKAVGLVNRVVPEAEVMKQAKGLAQRIAAKSKQAISRSMQAIRDGIAMSVDDGLALENRLFGDICETKDMREGVSAFLEKRQPKFTDE
ncbi:MAG: enoyl-CoA hydratase/isomerase family protein [Armatimonadota bacterium]|nr:MAG: enoyl-CoA hydratase/isomerase family protein [Armatimonadota bacterium]